MGSDSCLIFFGLRLEVRPGEVPALEEMTHSAIRRCRETDLKFHWDVVGYDEDSLFVGFPLGQLGPEDEMSLSLEESFVLKAMAETRVKLQAAGFDGEPRLHMCWLGDQ
ncbi:MAG: hypothetical protein HYY18_16450 [Planctomycetes bacterium]|nr:hypothetical protein [Planctomycetota bacterium]